MTELWDVTCHMGSHSVTCYPTQVNAPRLNPSLQAGARFTYPGGMEGWVDLGYPAMQRPEVKLATSRSQVWHSIPLHQAIHLKFPRWRLVCWHGLDSRLWSCSLSGIHRRRSSVNFRGKTFWIINKMPEFYVILDQLEFSWYFPEKLTKFPNFHDFCPKIVWILHNNCRKNIFPEF